MDNEPGKASDLEAECRSFTRYLIGREPPEYVIGKYLDAHEKSGIFEVRSDAMNRLLITFSAYHPSLAAVVDAYTTLFFRQAEVRKKWVVLIAILESCSPTDASFDVPDVRDTPSLWGLIVGKAALFVLALLLSMLLILPIHVISLVLGKKASA